jgi:ATP-dependent helicase YprA (DUF1998 family)
MNALVEDQLVRLRRALDGEGQLAWLDRHRHGHRFTFGRYTGQTPSPRNNLKRLYGRMDERAMAAAAHDQIAGQRERAEGLPTGTLPRHRPYVPRPLGAEQLSRPEMTAFAPDVLITNFSMLNVMLMRDNEERIFDQTRDWLAADRDAHCFHLVVDELHSYRGTAGTEVGLLLRKLLHRIDVQQSQLIVIGASASLGDDDDEIRSYLQEFFGRKGEGFSLFTGAPKVPGVELDPAVDEQTTDVLARVGRDAAAGTSPDPEEARATVEATRLGERLVAAALTDKRQIVARDHADLAATLFAGDADRASEAFVGMLSTLAAATALPIRAHLMFRTGGGWWACSDPECSELKDEHRDSRRVIGKLHAETRIRCECGARCLDLLCDAYPVCSKWGQAARWVIVR